MAHKILSTEDDEHIKKVLKYRLEKCGYDITYASTAEDVLNQLSGIDLLILDSSPDKKGSELCTRIRELGCSIPIIILSAQAQNKNIKEGLDAGANCYITKPYDNKDLIEKISTLVAGS